MVPEPTGGESHSFRIAIAGPVPLQVQFHTHADSPAQHVKDDIENLVYERENMGIDVKTPTVTANPLSSKARLSSGCPHSGPMVEVFRLHSLAGRIRSNRGDTDADEEKGEEEEDHDPMAAVHKLHAQLLQLKPGNQEVAKKSDLGDIDTNIIDAPASANSGESKHNSKRMTPHSRTSSTRTSMMGTRTSTRTRTCIDNLRVALIQDVVGHFSTTSLHVTVDWDLTQYARPTELWAVALIVYQVVHEVHPRGRVRLVYTTHIYAGTVEKNAATMILPSGRVGGGGDSGGISGRAARESQYLFRIVNLLKRETIMQVTLGNSTPPTHTNISRDDAAVQQKKKRNKKSKKNKISGWRSPNVVLNPLHASGGSSKVIQQTNPPHTTRTRTANRPMPMVDTDEETKYERTSISTMRTSMCSPSSRLPAAADIVVPLVTTAAAASAARLKLRVAMREALVASTQFVANGDYSKAHAEGNKAAAHAGVHHGTYSSPVQSPATRTRMGDAAIETSTILNIIRSSVNFSNDVEQHQQHDGSADAELTFFIEDQSQSEDTTVEIFAVETGAFTTNDFHDSLQTMGETTVVNVAASAPYNDTETYIDCVPLARPRGAFYKRPRGKQEKGGGAVTGDDAAIDLDVEKKGKGADTSDSSSEDEDHHDAHGSAILSRWAPHLVGDEETSL